MKNILLPVEDTPGAIAQPVVRKERDDASLLPAIMAGHHTPGVADRVNKFCLSVADIRAFV
jgi:hypothetical protein